MSPRRQTVATTGLLIALALAMVVPLWHDPLRPYFRSPDPDLVFSFQPLQLNDGVDAINAEHTGYVYFLLFSVVLRVVHFLRLIPVDRTTSLLPLSDAAFDAAYRGVILVGRGLSVALAGCFIVLVFAGTRALTRSPKAAALAAILLAVSEGTAIQSLLLRTELLASMFSVAAFFSLILAIRATDGRNAAWLAVAGACIALALGTKVQSIFIVLALPIIAIVFGRPPPPYSGPLLPAERTATALALAMLAIAAAIPAAALLWFSAVNAESTGSYQTIFLLYAAGAMAAFVFIYRLSWRRAAMGVSALAIGASAGLFLHLLHPNRTATEAIAAFIEHMLPYAGLTTKVTIPYGQFVQQFGQATLDVAREHFSWDQFVARPYRLLDWLVVVGAAWHVIDGNRRRALQALCLLGVAAALEIEFHLRYLPAEYLVLIDPWTILAFVIVAAPVLETPMQIRIAATALIALAGLVVLNLRVELAPQFLRLQTAKDACGQTAVYTPLIAAKYLHLCSS
jgi:Dolichyl-phosphate-mannose-protein mannosyltransferase